MPFAAAWGKRREEKRAKSQKGTMFQKPDSSGAVEHLSGRECLIASNVLDIKSRKKLPSVIARSSPVTSKKKAQERGVVVRLQRIKE